MRARPGAGMSLPWKRDFGAGIITGDTSPVTMVTDVSQRC